jgi:type II restriction enzyme
VCLRLEKALTEYKSHIKSFKDLITPYEATRAGFIEIALEKNRKASPFVEEARALRTIASEANEPSDLLKLDKIYGSLLTASGLSDKALTHLAKKDQIKAVQNLIDNFLKPAGEKFVEELVYRFLLTRGDTLGGMMRNIAGVIGERKFARSIIAMLSIQKTKYFWLHKDSKTWIAGSLDDADIENYLKGLSWKNKLGDRILLFNITVPNVKKNVDLCLLNCCHKDIENRGNNKRVIASPEYYIALGELKGGIDPAGADEHWKTANTALDRIRKAFSKKKMKPKTLFVGAAIENAMAKEIFSQLKRKILTNAANLTSEKQVFSLCKWLVNI